MKKPNKPAKLFFFFASIWAVNIANSLKLLWGGISIAMNRQTELLSGLELTAQYLSRGWVTHVQNNKSAQHTDRLHPRTPMHGWVGGGDRPGGGHAIVSLNLFLQHSPLLSSQQVLRLADIRPYGMWVRVKWLHVRVRIMQRGGEKR